MRASTKRKAAQVSEGQLRVIKLAIHAARCETVQDVHDMLDALIAEAVRAQGGE